MALSGHTNPAAKEQQSATLEKMILDCTEGKYKLVHLAVRWAEEVSKREELKGKPFSLSVETSLTELLSGKVKLSEVEKLAPVSKNKDKDGEPAKAEASSENSEKGKKEKK